MAKAKIAGGIQLSGKLGNGLVFVPYGDEMIVRTAPAQRKPNGWSSKQKAHRERFRAVSRHYRAYRDSIVKPIWNLSATVKYTGYNLFVQANMAAFDHNGEMSDPSLLHFSTGPVSLPQQFRVERLADDPTVIRIRWNPDLLNGQERSDDQLMGIFYAGDGSHPFELKVSRSEGEALLVGYAAPVHLYLFFRRADGSAYSPDKHFEV